MKQHKFIEKCLGEINDLKNEVQEMMLENIGINFEDIEEWGNKYRDVVARYDIHMEDEIESKLKSFQKMEKQNATEQEERIKEWITMEMQLHMKKKEEVRL